MSRLKWLDVDPPAGVRRFVVRGGYSRLCTYYEQDPSGQFWKLDKRTGVRVRMVGGWQLENATGIIPASLRVRKGL